MTVSQLGHILKATIVAFYKERPLHHGAALSYYALMALVPILYLSVSFFGSFVGQDTMIEIIRQVLQEQIGLMDVDGIIDFLGTVDLTSGSTVLRVAGIAALMISSTAILNSLKRSINEFYDLDEIAIGRKKRFVRSVVFRLISMLVIATLTSVIIILYFAETLVLGFEESHFPDDSIMSWLFSGFANHGIPIFLNLLVFTFIFKYLHDGVVSWKVAVTGGVVTGFFLYLGQLLIKYYIANYFFAAEGGVAGTMLVILVWVYYSSQILFLGAKFSCVYANYLDEPITIRM
jgi:membrane protein